MALAEIIEAISATNVVVGAAWSMSFADADPTAYGEGDLMIAVLGYDATGSPLDAGFAGWTSLETASDDVASWRILSRLVTAALIAGTEALPSWAGATPALIPQAILMVLRGPDAARPASAQTSALTSAWLSGTTGASDGVLGDIPVMRRPDDLLVAIGWAENDDGEPSYLAGGGSGYVVPGDGDSSAGGVGYTTFGERQVDPGGWIFARWYDEGHVTGSVDLGVWEQRILNAGTWHSLTFALRCEPIPAPTGVRIEATPGRIGLL